MAQAPQQDAAPTKEEALNLLIQNVRARMVEVQTNRNDASDLQAAAEAVNALIEHVEPKVAPVPVPAHQPAGPEAATGRAAPEEHKGR